MNHSRLRRRFLAAARYEGRCRSLNADPMLRPMRGFPHLSALDRLETVLIYDGANCCRLWDPTVDRRSIEWLPVEGGATWG